jgi:antitoxin (DNA-binding transcriptional repressor) of toxin-antitoxin stability system
MLANIILADSEDVMIQATMFEAKTQLSELVKRAQRGEKIVLTSGRKKVPVAEIVALNPLKERVFDLFHHPDFEIPADFDELPDADLRAWRGEGK